ncbi:hypothetical protein BGX29_002511, partial [Mortierella sp. GBA35]
FVDIQELVDLLLPLLAQEDLSRLARTSRRMHMLCAPVFYRELGINSRNRLLRAFASIPAMAALGRNIQHVKKVDFRLDELAFYYNCVLAFEELNSQTTDPQTTPRPSWLPPADPVPLTLKFVPLPPLTNLVAISLSFNDTINSNRLPSVEKPRATLAQLCWMLSLNSHLARLHVDCIQSMDLRDLRLFCTHISRLSWLVDLRLVIESLIDNLHQLGSDLFFSCQPSIKRLSIIIVQGGEEEEEEEDEKSMLDQDDSIGEENDDGGSGDLVMLGRMQEPLVNLDELALWDIGETVSTADILSIFARCPNITKLKLPAIVGHHDIGVIGEFVGKECPKIQSLFYSSTGSAEQDPLPFRIASDLHAQQLKEFECHGRLSGLSDLSTNIPLLTRHSTSLRRIVLNRMTTLGRISASAILKECSNLEVLLIECYLKRGLYIDLADALEHPWSCTKLRRLSIGINGCELPVEPGFQPYYSRPAPITLFNEEKHHFAQLERLYLQIGALTELRSLNLAMVKIDGQGQANGASTSEPTSFPALMSLGDPLTGRRGYLGHLAGLKNLEVLEGSIRADAEETKVTMGWKEVKFMVEYWPQLERAKFFSYCNGVREPFEWLRQNHRGGRMPNLFGPLRT